MNQSKTRDIFFKVVYLGNSGVGKTSLMKYYKNKGDVPLNIQSTLGVDIVATQDTLRDGSPIKYILFDTPGQERWKSVSFSHYKNAQGVLLIYSVTDRSSFEDIKRWVEDINNNCDDAIWFLIANKTDVESGQRVVSYNDGEQLAKVYGVNFFETSIYEQKRPNHSLSVNDIMTKMGEMMVQRKKEKGKLGSEIDGFSLQKNQNQTSQNKSGCRC